MLRIEEARAQRGVTAAALWLSLSTNASYASTRLSEITATGSLFTTPGIGIPNPYNQYQLGVDASWELDLSLNYSMELTALLASPKVGVLYSL